MAGGIPLLIYAKCFQNFCFGAQMICFLLQFLRLIVAILSKNLHRIVSSVRSVCHKIDDTCTSAPKFAENLILINRSLIQLLVHSLIDPRIAEMNKIY